MKHTSFTVPTWALREPSEIKSNFYMNIAKNGEQVSRVQLNDKTLYEIGRLEGSDLTLAHPSISRQHAFLIHGTNHTIPTTTTTTDKDVIALNIIDFHSSHGTFMAGPVAATQTEEAGQEEVASADPFTRLEPYVAHSLTQGSRLRFGGSSRTYTFTAEAKLEEKVV